MRVRHDQSQDVDLSDAHGRRRRWPALILALSLALAACGSNGDPDTSAPTDGSGSGTETEATGEEPPDLGELRVIFGAPNTHIYMALQKGNELGAWDGTGLTVIPIEGTNTSVQQGLASGSADIGMQSGFTAFQNIVQGVDATVVASNTNVRSQYLVVRDDSPFETVDDLTDGHELIFGITGFASQGYASTTALASDLGLVEETDFTVAALGGINEILAAFDRGTINAFFWSAAVSFRLEASGDGRVIAAADDYLEPSVGTAINVLNRTLEERPEAVRAYLEGYFRTVEMLRNDLDIVVDILVEWGLDEGTARLIAENEMPNISIDGTTPAEALDGVTNEVVANLQDEGFDLEGYHASDHYRYWKDLFGVE